jgi:hypothetical protein
MCRINLYTYVVRLYHTFCIIPIFCTCMHIYNILCSLQNIPFARADLLRATAQASKGTNNKYFILKEIKTCHVIN